MHALVFDVQHGRAIGNAVAHAQHLDVSHRPLLGSTSFCFAYAAYNGSTIITAADSAAQHHLRPIKAAALLCKGRASRGPCHMA